MQVFRSTLAFFERRLGASASERYPRPAIDERRMKVLNKLVEPRGELMSVILFPGSAAGLMSHLRHHSMFATRATVARHSPRQRLEPLEATPSSGCPYARPCSQRVSHKLTWLPQQRLQASADPAATSLTATSIDCAEIPPGSCPPIFFQWQALEPGSGGIYYNTTV